MSELHFREIPDERLREILSQLSLGLERTTDFGMHLLKWFAEVDSSERHRIVFMMLLRQFLELLDAISILVRQSSIDPCKPVLRSMFEIFLSFEYMLQEDTKKRANAFVVAYIYSVLRDYRKADPSTAEGKEHIRKIMSNQKFPVSSSPTNPDWATNIQMLETELALPDYEETRKEYISLQAKTHGYPRWYSLYDGPRSIEQLAARVKLSALYESHYRVWSGPLHGTDVFANKSSPIGQGKVGVVQIRYVKDAQLVCANAFTIALGLFRTFVDALLPEYQGQLKSWFQTMFEYGAIVNGPDFINVIVEPPSSGS
ncbi:MAG: DUF5677 domain-containing protein [Bacteroidota bacterium]|jgi:hypothetical protein